MLGSRGNAGWWRVMAASATALSLPCTTGAQGLTLPHARRCPAVSACSGRVSPPLCIREIHSRRSTTGRGDCLAEHKALAWWETPPAALQRRGASVVAKRSRSASPALAGVAPVPYRRTPRSRLSYRRSAYWLTTDRSTPARQLLQVYLDRWEIEVNHHDGKTILGVGQAQLWSRRSVARQPALVVAAYRALLLAGWEGYGATRNEVYRSLPQWRRHSQRPSCLDLVT
jgi:hypothetical protein